MVRNDKEIIGSSLLELYFYWIVLPFLHKPVKKLEVYLNQNASLFTLIGVFGAISVYSVQLIEQLGLSGTILGRIATATGFSLVVLICIVVIIDLFRRGYQFGPFARFENFGLLAFLVFFTPLVMVIIIFLGSFTEIWKGYYIPIAYSLGLFIPVVFLVTTLEISSKVGEYVGAKKIILAITAFIYLTAGSLLINRYQGSVSREITQEELSYSFIVDTFTLFLFGGISLTIIASVGILITTILYLLYSWIRKKFQK